MRLLHHNLSLYFSAIAVRTYKISYIYRQTGTVTLLCKRWLTMENGIFWSKSRL